MWLLTLSSYILSKGGVQDKEQARTAMIQVSVVHV